MKLVLFRHGPAGRRDPRRWPDDAVRPLTGRGQERTRAAARGLRRLLGSGQVAIVTSPYVRCASTALILAECFKTERVAEDAALEPGGSYRSVLKLLGDRKPGDVVVLVGHEPDLGKLAGTLLFGAPSPLPLRKAGACVLHFVAAVEPGAAILHGFYPPRILRRMAGRKAHA
jgi:phosphohistidine phosphatase